MRKLKEHWHNLVDPGAYGGMVEDILIVMFCTGVLFAFIYSILKSGGAI